MESKKGGIKEHNTTSIPSPFLFVLGLEGIYYTMSL